MPTGLAPSRGSGNGSLDLATHGGKLLPSSSQNDEATFDKHGVIGQDECRNPICVARVLDEAVGPPPSIPHTLGCERLGSRDSVG